MTRQGLTMTMAAAAVAALPWIAVASAQEPAGAPPHREFGRGPGGPGMGPHFAEALGLSEEQKTQMEALRSTQRETMKPLFESARAAHEAFRTALDAEGADAATVGRAALAMKAAETKLRAAHEAAREEMKALLTPEQRDKLDKLEQSRETWKGPHRNTKR
jgi:periplasmic protein CpxP/Spy